VSARQRLGADLARYYAFQTDPGSRVQRCKTILLTEAIWVIVVYRFGQYLEEEAPPALRALLRAPYKLLMKALHLVVDVHLFPETRIGGGLYIGHYGGTWISPLASLGANCNVNHGVTIGAAGGREKAPVLGDRVWVGPGAVITGPIQVGSGAVVAANSLVVANVPDDAVVIGVPARVVSYSGSADLLAAHPT
jgi:serine O-acetyltransferase